MDRPSREVGSGLTGGAGGGAGGADGRTPGSRSPFDFDAPRRTDKDYYDGLVDAKRGAEYVTVSWNHFHDHWKTVLVGHTDNASPAPDRITHHHNYFRNVNSRVPLVRYADLHLLNNVMEDVTGSATNARNGARVMIEGNHHTRVGGGNNDPHANRVEGPVGWWYGSGGTGHRNPRDNTFVDTPHEHLSSTTGRTPPYAYEVDSPGVARHRLLEYAGVGEVDVTPRPRDAATP
ncbi:hypothetical protein [Streptomyces sp. ST2-7A]|uniref:pectate lyase family protein n=1 Tax=Streptomyces sp. ST2-7A TaxID=2907214 RepID=UPI001F319665|nr:hypothetical protein [Streptomyces sp. ST2-7A]MCE7082725.1 hypothetical protein [Streptomyces sp. ST2-7A]